MPQAPTLRASTTLGTRAADTRPSTWREEDLSIEVVAATETPTRMRVWEYDREICTYRSREFDEILDITGMRQEDLDAFVGCPVLDSHSTWSTGDIVGVIDEARRDGTELIVRVRLSKTEEDLVSKVREGIIRKVSIGYHRRAGATVTEREGDVALRRQPFTPAELSFVAVPADANTGTRSLASVAALSTTPAPATASNRQDTTMNVEAIRSAMTAFSTAMTAALDAGPSQTQVTDDAARVAIEGGTRSTQVPVQQPTAAQPAQTQAPAQRSQADEASARAAALPGLRSAAQVAGVNLTIFDGLAGAGESLEGLRGLIRTQTATSTPEIDATRSAPAPQQGQTEFVDFDRAVAAQRSADQSDIAKLAAALAGLGAR